MPRGRRSPTRSARCGRRTGFNTGSASSAGTVAIANTVEDTLYRTERYDPAAARS